MRSGNLRCIYYKTSSARKFHLERYFFDTANPKLTTPIQRSAFQRLGDAVAEQGQRHAGDHDGGAARRTADTLRMATLTGRSGRSPSR
jgi:hypothetical protein